MSNKDEVTKYPVDNHWQLSMGSMIGSFELAPTEGAKAVWEMVKKYPDKYCFGFSYTEDEKTGEKELIGISLIPAPNFHYRDKVIIACSCITCSGYCGCGIKGHHNKKPSVEG